MKKNILLFVFLSVFSFVGSGQLNLVEKDEKGDQKLIKSKLSKEDYETYKKNIQSTDFDKLEKDAENGS